MPTDPPDSAASRGESGNFFERLGKRLEAFWQRVSEGMELQALWSQFVAEARESYGLYSREIDWAALKQETGFKRLAKTASALFWAMVLKLSPARRVFLLIALVFGILALVQTRVTVEEHGTVVHGPENFTFVLLSVGGLVFLLALELADRVTMKRDLEIAREIQRWLVPEKPPQVEGVDLAFASRPANTVGGDFYDAFLRRTQAGERLLLVVADVAGKSVPAALLMATFQASLRTLAGATTSLEELVTGLNRYACQHSLGGTRFTTAFFAELDPATRELTYIRAGQNEPIVRRASAGVERLAAGNLPLGIAADARFSASAVRLAAGDLLVIFTDGLVEAVNAQDEMFDEERALEALAAVPGASAEQALKNLMAAVDAFVGPTRQHDDITLLVARTV